MTNTQNFIIKQGTDWTRVLTWKTGNPALPVDLTSATAVCKIRTVPESLIVVAQPSISLGGSAGTLTLNLTDVTTTAMVLKGAKTGSLQEGTEVATGLLGVYDIMVTIGTTTCILSGQICFVLAVSR